MCRLVGWRWWEVKDGDKEGVVVMWEEGGWEREEEIGDGEEDDEIEEEVRGGSGENRG